MSSVLGPFNDQSYKTEIIGICDIKSKYLEVLQKNI